MSIVRFYVYQLLCLGNDNYSELHLDHWPPCGRAVSSAGAQDLLVRNFNEQTVPELMCTNTVNVGWDGKMYLDYHSCGRNSKEFYSVQICLMGYNSQLIAVKQLVVGRLTHFGP